MSGCILKFQNLTSLQSAQRLLQSIAITSRAVQVGKSTSGCGFGLEIDCMFISAAERMLSRYGIFYKK